MFGLLIKIRIGRDTEIDKECFVGDPEIGGLMNSGTFEKYVGEQIRKSIGVQLDL